MGSNKFTTKFSLRKLSVVAAVVLFAGTIGTAGMATAARGFNNKLTRDQCRDLGFDKFSECLLGNPSPSVCKKLGFTSKFACIQDKPTRAECNASNFSQFARCINQWRREKQRLAHGYGNNNQNQNDDNDEDDRSGNENETNNNDDRSVIQRVLDAVRG